MSIPALIQTHIILKSTLLVEESMFYFNSSTWEHLDRIEQQLRDNKIEVFGKSKEQLENLLTEKIIEIAGENSNIKLKKITFK